MHRFTPLVAGALLLCACPIGASGQTGRFELGVQTTSATSDQFDGVDLGLGGRVAWRPTAAVGLEAEFNLYPADYPDVRPFSRGRVEGLFGVTFGPRVGRLRPFAKVRSGFLNMDEAPRPFPCILIFPPPLACALATGSTLPALDIGGGVDLSLTRRTFLRVDVGDRVLKYPGPAFDDQRRVQRQSFWGHGVRLSAGAGVRF